MNDNTRNVVIPIRLVGILPFKLLRLHSNCFKLGKLIELYSVGIVDDK